ncbi:sulfite exporter TauE/SafE family protein [Myroides sp. DF42-4-2]|uniref:sulfite exporter TauE/SafE family protein n=1 Tax=unclassified Myroides TaxID=2642485 RepID=UPI002576BB46|nr:sulfite exporter TauE/SafE family protein [Myroides sp. DF42-4-2]MDM1406562.1 sulfite exporter TauE/SafE family protein [Myroides sp. DF42-4-2]
MSVLTFILILFLGAFAAGFIGSLSGLGGGIIIIPLLSVFLGVDIHYAIGTALVAVIATSSGSASAYVREGITNMRLGMFLEIATTIGAVVGALLSTNAPTSLLAIIFGATLIFSSMNSIRKKEDHLVLPNQGSVLAQKLKLAGNYPHASGEKVHYSMTNILGGFSMMGVAGMMSGLLGIGSGAFKVIAMDTIMKVPFKVSTTTSNFMMGVTAIASSVIYIQKGYIEPTICMPVIIGVLIGSMVGAKVLMKANTKKLKMFFAVLIFIIALNMIYNGITGKI